MVAGVAGMAYALLSGHAVAIPAALLIAVLAGEASTLASVQLQRLQDGQAEPTAKVSPLDLEPGFGLSVEQRRYRSWLWAKRCSQVVMVGVIVHALRNPDTMTVMGAVLWLAIILGVIMEQHLVRLRPALGLRSAGLADLELGACILSQGGNHGR